MDGECFKRLADDPGSAVYLIMQRHGTQLRRRVEQFIKEDEELVKDVISETIVALWTDGTRVAQMEDPFFWMMKVAKYLAISAIRAERKQLKVPIEHAHYLTDGIQADTALDHDELYERFMRATDTLTRKERDVLLDSRLHGLDNKELGAMHGITVQRVKNILSSALKKVRLFLKDG